MLHIYHIDVVFIYWEMLPLFKNVVTSVEWHGFNRLYSSLISGMPQPDWDICDFPAYASICPDSSSIGHDHLPNDCSLILPFDIYITSTTLSDSVTGIGNLVRCLVTKSNVMPFAATVELSADLYQVAKAIADLDEVSLDIMLPGTLLNSSVSKVTTTKCGLLFTPCEYAWQ